MAIKRDVSAGQDGGRLVTLDSYGRLSRVPETGELEKIDVQWADNRTVIKRVGAQLGEELQDGLSAWKRGVRRPGWETLLERVESGVVDGVVVWHTDRLFRQPRDLEKLIELGERGFKVYSAHGTRDLSDPDDRFILRIEVAHAARSSDDTSGRLKRRFTTFREQGKASGPRRFGFPGKDLTWTPGPGQTKEDQPVVSAELVARERQAIRDAAEAVLIVYSADGTIDILPRLRPRVRKSDVQQAVQRYLDIAKPPLPKYDLSDAWNDVKKLKFYLSEDRCRRVNSARQVLDQWNRDHGRLIIVESDLMSKELELNKFSL
jgi:DNA invertase Pin-like site-specific DNA recombinase